MILAIKIVNGDLLTSDDNIICHQVNCQKKIASGVALAIRNKWAIVYGGYKRLSDNCESKNLLGYTQFIKINDSLSIANMFAQEYYGYDGKQYTSYEAFEKCIDNISERAIEHNLTVAMPYNIGCARGGASWERIYELLNKYFGAEDQPSLTLYKLR
jgi:hypothetical protein